MSAVAADLALRFEVEDLYARYIACVDSGNLDAWPDFFTDPCVYRLAPRENHDRGLPLATLSFESRGMLKDRVYAVTQTLFHQPYYQRHILSGLRIVERHDDELRVRGELSRHPHETVGAVGGLQFRTLFRQARARWRRAEIFGKDLRLRFGTDPEFGHLPDLRR